MTRCPSTTFNISNLVYCQDDHNYFAECYSVCYQLQCMEKSFPETLVATILNCYMLLAATAYEWQRRQEHIPQINRLYIVSVLCSFALSCTGLLLITVHKLECTALLVTCVTFYTLVVLIVYTVLWTRQLRFYTDPMLSSSSTFAYRVLSWSVIVGIYSFTLSALTIFFFVYQIQRTRYGCVFISRKGTLAAYLVPCATLVSVVCIVFKLLLSALTVFPLVTDKSRVPVKVCCLLSKKWSFKDLEADIKCLFVRLVLCTLACFVSSLVSGVVFFLSLTHFVCLYTVAICSWHALVVNFTLVCSFSDWSCRLVPCNFSSKAS